MTFKQIIKKELTINHWELINIDSLGEWWEDEHWKIQWRHKDGLSIYLQFLIDPMDASIVSEIKALNDLHNGYSEIASLCMSKRKFNSKLEDFIEEIEDYRVNFKKEKVD